MSTNPADNGRRKMVVAPVINNNSGGSLLRFIAISALSCVVHGALLGLLFVLLSLIGTLKAAAPEATDESIQTTQVEEEKPPDFDLSNTDIGEDPTTPYNLNVDRVNEDVVVPGNVDLTQPPGVEGSPIDAPRTNVPPPPGSGGGMGGGLPNLDATKIGNLSKSIGGMGGTYLAGGFGFRGSAATKQKLLADQGGNAPSEAAVARGLQWLAWHQNQDGHWSLNGFNKTARDKPRPSGKIFRCNCQIGTGNNNDVAATGFGLLPFLGAGVTHQSTKTTNKDYTKTVEGALHWLMGRQNLKTGSYSDDMYAHGIATIAMCEAYGLTSDPKIKTSAQRALNFIVYAQDDAGGGWRYSPKQAGDTSVTGWQLMALKSGQMAGLSVPTATLTKSKRFLDSVESSDKGGFSYVAGQGPSITMTSVGLLCRQYSGLGPKNPSIQNGVERLKKAPPGSNDNIYYLYYATQVMHHMQGDSWKFWNLGPKGDGKGGIRDVLMAKQDKGTTPGHPHQVGSWGGSQGGRIMATSLSLLCLEVYYRHLPLYRRDLATGKGGE
jgi:hypothetical protein